MLRNAKNKLRNLPVPFWARFRDFRAPKGRPIELQLPITFKCNFDCVMCGMSAHREKDHISPEVLGTILQDDLFVEITDVGINGGEPFLRDDVVECVSAVVGALPKLHAIHFISNGYFTERIVDQMPRIKEVCGAKGVKVGLSISVDGVEEMQDRMRGLDGAYDHACATIDAIKRDPERFCDHLGIICTITKINVFRLYELEEQGRAWGVPISYNIATVNKRIGNEGRYQDFSIFSDEESRLMAQEFFFQQYVATKEKRYYALFLYVKEGTRYSPCVYRSLSGVTLNPDGQLAFCATHSESLGDAFIDSSAYLFDAGREYHELLCAKECETCSHYMHSLDYEGESLLLRWWLRNMRLKVYRKGWCAIDRARHPRLWGDEK